MICMRLCALHTIHYAVFNTLETKLPNAYHCTLPSTLWSTLLVALDCTLPACLTYAPSMFDLCSQVHLQASFQRHCRACPLGRSQSHSMVHSQPAWLYAPKQALKTLPGTPPSTLPSTPACTLPCTPPSTLPRTPPSTLPSTPPSMLPSTPPSMLQSTQQSILSWMLRIALDGTLPACLTVHSQLHSQDAFNCTRWHIPSLLHCMFPRTHSRRSQSHMMAHSQPA